MCIVSTVVEFRKTFYQAVRVQTFTFPWVEANVKWSLKLMILINQDFGRTSAAHPHTHQTPHLSLTPSSADAGPSV
jgi:hypothetical protein